MKQFAALSILGVMVCAGVAGIASVAQADCRPRGGHHAQNIVLATTLAYTPPVIVPSYQVSYGHGNQDALVQALLKSVDEVGKLRAEVLALRQGIQGVQAPAPHPQMPPAAAVNDGELGAYVRNCAQCHDKQTANKGGGFVLTENGGLSPMSMTAAAKTLVLLATEEMPKGRKMSQEDYVSIIAGMRKKLFP